MGGLVRNQIMDGVSVVHNTMCDFSATKLDPPQTNWVPLRYMCRLGAPRVGTNSIVDDVGPVIVSVFAHGQH